MSTASTCPQCGAGLPADAPRGLCPRCLLRAGQVFVESAAEPRGLSLPCSFANYELIEEIARGGMGVVFKARQKGLGRLVAVKMILAGRFASREFLRRFQAEAETIARLRHPHIVAVHEVGEFEGQPFFSMDFIAGRNLAQVIAETGFTQLGFDRIARWLRTIALAVEHAHAHGVLHRDLKPANILIDTDDEPRVTDFGLAKHLDVAPVSQPAVSPTSSRQPPDNPEARQPTDAPAGWKPAIQQTGSLRCEDSLTHSGQVLGSPSYAPPEQAAGRHREIGPPSDVYALGAILFHLLTGRPPFAAASLASTITQVLQAEPVAPRVLNPSVPRDLETICLKCLEKEPRRRYATAREFADEIERFRRNEPIAARSVGFAGRVWRWSRRQPAQAGLTAAFAISVMAGFAGVLWQLQRVNHLAREQTVQRQRAEAAASRLELERAEELFAGDDAPAALSYLARVLRRTPTDPVAAARLLSALTFRNFALPLSEPIPTTNQVNWVRFSPDETRVVLACFDGSAQVWDLQTGQPVTPPMWHKERVRYAEFSPDGSRIVTASADHTARVWDAATGEPVTPPLTHAKFVNTAHFSPDGQWIVTASDDATAGIWNARTGEAASVPKLHAGGSVLVAVFSPDGRVVLTGDSGDGVARFWDSRTGQPIGRAIPHGERIRTGGFSPDGRQIVLGGYDGTARLWDTKTGQPVGEPMKHEGIVQCAEFSPDGLRLLTAAGNFVRLWDAITTQPTTEPIRHPSLVTSAQFSRDGQRLFVSSYDTPVRVWDIAPCSMLTTLVSGRGGLHDLAFSRDGRKLALAIYASVQIWDATTWEAIGPRWPLPFPSKRVQFYPDGQSVLTTMSGGVCQRWDLASGAPKFPMFDHGHLVDGPASSDGELVIVEGHDDTAEMAAGNDTPNTGTIWNVRTGQQIAPPLQHRNSVEFASFSRDGRQVATASHDRTARVWDVRSGQPLTPPLAHDRHVSRARFSPDGRWLVTASDDTTARIWDLRKGGALRHRLQHDAAVQEAEFSSDGTRVLTASLDRTARVWDAASGRPLTEPLEHPNPVLRARFSPDGQTVATASLETLRLWDASSGLPVSEPLQHRGELRAFDFSPDGRWLVSGSRRQTVYLRELPHLTGPAPDWLIELAEAFAGRSLDRSDEREAVSWKRVIELRRMLQPEPDRARSPGAARGPREQAQFRQAAGRGYALRAGTARGPVDEDRDAFLQWGRWFFFDRATRHVSPSSPLAVEDYLRHRVEEPFIYSLFEVLRFQPTNFTALARLGGKVAEWDAVHSPAQREAADRLTRHALRLHPNQVAMVRARAETACGLGQSAEALSLVDRWLALAPNDANAFELRARLHTEGQRWAEAWADFSKASSIDMTNPAVAVLRSECFQRAFLSEFKSQVVQEGQAATLTGRTKPHPEVSWQWQGNGADIPGATGPSLALEKPTEADFGPYRVKLRHSSGETVTGPTVLLRREPVAETITGQWDFDAGSLAATLGHDLEFFDGPAGETATRTRFGTTTELGIPDIGGKPARVMRFPPASPTMGYLARHGALPNGGGRRVNQYTIIMDVLIPSLKQPENAAPKNTIWTAFFQTNLRNPDNAEFYLDWSGGRGRPGVAGQYDGGSIACVGCWHRLTAAVDLAAPKPVLSKYVDGRKHADQTILHDTSAGDPPEGLDGRFSLLPVLLLFTDDDWETSAGYVNSIQFHNVKLTDEQIAALGGPSAEGIPLAIPLPQTNPAR